MANTGTYGTGIPVRIDINDVDIFYSYSDSRNSDSSTDRTFNRLPSSLLEQASYNADTADSDGLLEGMYNLKLPLQYFSRKGYYTVYIKPKETAAVIYDVSTLFSQPDIRGIVLDSNTMNQSIKQKAITDNGLVGYRLIYINDNGARENYYRLITSNNKCEPVIQTSTNGALHGSTYRYNEAASMIFCTVTPSSAPSFKANSAPFIGKVGQKVLLVNTAFEPIMLDIEIVDHDADTISTMLEGSQLRSLDNGLVTTFDDNNEIYHQAEHYTLKENGVPVYEIKKNRNNSVDYTQTLQDKLV